MLLTRRRVLFSVTGAGVLHEATAEGGQRSSESTELDKQSVAALQDIAAQLRAFGDPPVITTIRDAQRQFLRANQRFPEFIEVGISVWEQLYDWHIHTQQPLTIARLNDGRYAMTTLMSTLVLNVGAAATYVGPGSPNP
jgi:hypothetical protein